MKCAEISTLSRASHYKIRDILANKEGGSGRTAERNRWFAEAVLRVHSAHCQAAQAELETFEQGEPDGRCTPTPTSCRRIWD